MRPSISSVRVSRYRLAIAVVVTVAMAAMLAVSDDFFVGGLLVTVFGSAFLFANALDAVREHPLYHVANAAWVGLFALLWYFTVSRGNPVVLGAVALAAVGVVVELYNYRRGTSYLRIDF